LCNIEARTPGRITLPERIYKLQPNRTIQLGGFDGLGASAALHSATESSFKVSGIFRDPADFAVLVLYDADNFYEHPHLKYLPDTDFSGLTLTFDVHYKGLMPLDSPKYATIDWPYLDVIRPDGSTARVRLFEYAVLVGGSYTEAGAIFTVVDNGLEPYDRLTLWYLNYAFDYIVPNNPGPLPTAADVAAALAAQINAVNWTAVGTLIPLRAEADENRLHLTADRAGEDGNMITLYAVSKNSRLTTSEPTARLEGGSSDATWRITLDFEALGIPEIRKMWLTFAPKLANGAEFTDTEWEAVFTNWTVSGLEERRALMVAGPGSVRIEENDSWCTYTGTWTVETGFYSQGFASKASSAGDSVTVFYACHEMHDLYIGTSLYRDRGKVTISLDGDQVTELDCKLETDQEVVTRRKVRSGVAPGAHTVKICLSSAGCFYFDFLEAAVPSDVPESAVTLEKVSPALDYSTDHTYKLPPARILWILDKLGYAGPMNEYIGVFWWNQRKRINAHIPSVTVTFAGEFLDGDQVFLKIGGQVCGKTVFPNENAEIIAKHFAYFINATYVGVWAVADSNVLTITARSPRPAYSFSFDTWKETVAGSSGTVAFTGLLSGGCEGEWAVDPSQTASLNRGARDWHADLLRECKIRDREITLAVSMELVNPPEGFAAKFPDGEPVRTAVGFGNLVSTHCSFSRAVREYQQQVYADLAALMTDAGLAPRLQFGEFCWWYFSNLSETNPGGGMAYYDPETMTAAAEALGRPLHLFTSPDDDPGVNGFADATFLRNRLRDHVAAIMGHVRGIYSDVHFEVLFPYDVNYPCPTGVHHLGGRLNRLVNLPAEWEKKETSGLDCFKTEALDFGAWCRNLDLSREAILLPLQTGWPRESVRHLTPVFRPGYAWQKECLQALNEQLQAVNLWAFDHVCLFGLNIKAQTTGSSARRLG